MARRIIGELIESGELSERAKNISFNDGVLYDYNQDAYVKLVDAMEKDGKACAIRATGTGKMYLAIKWLNDNPDKPFVYVAPTNVILNRFVDNLIEVYFPDNADKLKKLVLEDEIKYLEQNLGFDLHLYTYAKIHRMSTEDMQKVNASHIVLDEFHRCGADKWGKSVNEFLLINSNAKVMGLSATPIRPSDGKNMVEEMFDGKMASELTLVDALEQNILPLPVMINAIYSFEDEIVSLESRLFNKKYDPEKQKEIDKTLKQVKQLIGQSGGVKAIFSDFIEELTRNKGKQDIKMVVFCKDIADRDRKMDECKNWFEKGTKIKKYSVTSKESEKSIEVEDDIEESAKSKKLRQKVIKTFEEDNSKGVKLLFAVDMLNEGLHVKNLDGVIMLRDTSSNIVFLQQLGRALAVDKDRTTPPLVFDLVNNIEVLGEDIEEYREIIHQLTKNKGYQQRELHQYDFEIQKQIIDMIQYLKDITYDFTDRIAPLIAYYKEFGTIADIKQRDRYEFNGQVYNIGILIHTLKIEYNKGKLEQEEIDLLESMGMRWDKIKQQIPYEKKIEVLTAYKDDYTENGGKGTIGNIKQRDKYIYQGVTYPIGIWRDSFVQGGGLGKGEEKERRIKELNALGMVWAAYDEKYRKKIEILTAYKDDYTEKGGKGSIGHIRVKDIYTYQGVEYPIGEWRTCFIQGIGLDKGEEKERRIKELNALGMIWDASKGILWEEKKEVLTAYKNDYSDKGGKGTIGNIKNRDTYIYQGNEYPIGEWRKSFIKGTGLGKGEEKERRIQELNDMGMVWEKKTKKSTPTPSGENFGQ